MERRNTGKGRSGKPATGKGRTADKTEKRSFGPKRTDGPVKRNAVGDSRKPGRPAGKSFKSENAFDEKPKRVSKAADDARPKRAYGKPSSDGPKRSFGADKPRTSSRRDDTFSGKPKRFAESENTDDARPKRAYTKREDGVSKSTRTSNRSTTGFGDKPFSKGKTERPKKTYDKSSSDGPKRAYGKSSADGPKRSFGVDKPFRKSTGKTGGFSKAKSSADVDYNEGADRKPRTDNYGKPYKKKPYKPASFSSKTATVRTAADDGLTRLNKYVANTGICSRREADELITAGAVSVNGEIVTELGLKIDPTKDTIHYGGQLLRSEKLRYVLLNKPKDYITTTDDPQERRTVMELIKDACRERIYPVGRLDRATTGLLLLTNDGELTKRLTHPKYEIKKIYHVELDKNLKQADFEKVKDGFDLEDGFIKVDTISYTGETKKEVGVEIHSGRNRIVRRIFESMGYKVHKLDRVYFGGLTKKDLPRGRYRLLSEMEINMLKMLTGNKTQVE